MLEGKAEPRVDPSPGPFICQVPQAALITIRKKFIRTIVIFFPFYVSLRISSQVENISPMCISYLFRLMVNVCVSMMRHW